MEYVVMGDDIWDFKKYSFAINRHICNINYPLHIHEFSETFIIMGGQGRHITAGGSSPLHRGDVFACKGDFAHGFSDVKDMDIINIDYVAKRLMTDPSLKTIPGFIPLFLETPVKSQYVDYPYQLHLDEKDLEYVAAMEKIISSELTGNNAFSETIIKQNFIALMSFIACRYARDHEMTRKMQVFSEAKHYISKHLSEKIYVDSIAENLNMSSRQLNRIFRDCGEVSPIDYIIQMRLKAATDLLTNSNMDVAQVAEMVGFENATYFSKTYKKICGICPRQIKKHVK